MMPRATVSYILFFFPSFVVYVVEKRKTYLDKFSKQAHAHHLLFLLRFLESPCVYLLLTTTGNSCLHCGSFFCLLFVFTLYTSPLLVSPFITSRFSLPLCPLASFQYLHDVAHYSPLTTALCACVSCLVVYFLFFLIFAFCSSCRLRCASTAEHHHAPLSRV